MAVVVTRTFTASDGTAITTAEPTLSAHPVSASSTATVLSNAVRGNTSSTELYIDSQDPGVDDYEATVTLRRNAAGTINILGVVSHLDASAGTFLHARVSGAQLQLYQFVSGTATQIGSNFSLGTLLDNVSDSLTLTVGRTGTTAYMKVNGTQQRSGTTTVSGRGRMGMRLATSSNVIVMDDLTLDDLTSGGGGGGVPIKAFRIIHG